MATMSSRLSHEEAVQDKTEKIDFKMVTFSLAGKDYGLDIMRVKEIAKDNEFTFVPNTAPYVRGVYNLRGDIISIIDLRLMFRVPIPQKEEGALENMIILNLRDHIIGVIVDSTDKVVGISSESIQPPHPLFGDINVKFISGVVEHDSKLYIILDAQRIFGIDPADKSAAGARIAEKADDERPERVSDDEAERTPAIRQDDAFVFAEPAKVPVDLGFISETLATFKKFHVSPLNETWVRNRFGEWKGIKGGGPDLQLKNPEEADEFLTGFLSPYSFMLFGEDYSAGITKLLPQKEGANISLWNPGCGKGYESYSLACILHNVYPGRRIKIWANDSDLLGISNAPGLFFQMRDLPDQFKRYMVETRNGYQFSTEIKESVYFEYHDILNGNPFPEVDIIVARDMLSFQTPGNQEKLLEEFASKLKPGGLLFLGSNETAEPFGWSAVRGEGIVAYKIETG